MNIPELKAAIAKRDFTIPKLADAIGISKKTLYTKIEGTSSFTQKEIARIATVLSLSNEEIIGIFFAEKVA